MSKTLEDVIWELNDKFVLEKGYNKIIYYAYNESAINLCRKRGYKEDFNEDLK